MAEDAEQSSAVPEIPFLSDIMVVVTTDLDASRGLQQRLLAIGDTYLATALSIASIFAGIGFATKNWIGLVPIPVVVALGCLDGVNWVRFKHASARVRHLEALVDAYVGAIRERKTVRAQAVGTLRQRVDRYHYDMESSIDAPTWSEVYVTNRSRLRWLLYPGLVLALLLSSILLNVS
jgi:hypothetical protein